MPGRERDNAMGAEDAGIFNAVPSQVFRKSMDSYRHLALSIQHGSD